jgi:hypothetical protein
MTMAKRRKLTAEQREVNMQRVRLRKMENEAARYTLNMRNGGKAIR